MLLVALGKCIESAIAFGLAVSLGNDLGYRLFQAVFMGEWEGVLWWYARHFGLLGDLPIFTFHAGPVRFVVTAFAMSASIFLRLAAIFLLHLKSRRGSTCRSGESRPRG